MTTTTTEFDRATIRRTMAFLYRADAEDAGRKERAAMWARFEAAELAAIDRLS